VPSPRRHEQTGTLVTEGQHVGGARLAGAWKWWAARPALSAAVIYAVLSVVFVGQGLMPGRTLSNADMLWSGTPWTASAPPDVRFGGANFELADSTAVFLPFFEHAKRAIGDPPLWNPYVMGGRPYLANAQSAVFSPFTAPIYAMSVWKALAVAALLKLFVAAFGTYLLGRALGMRFAGALLAGAVYAFGTFFVAWLAWPLTNIFPLLPWLLLLTELVVRHPSRLPAAGLALVAGLAFLGGHPETTFHTLSATVVFFAFRVLFARPRETGLARPVVVFGLSLAGGAALAAVMLVPLLELFVHSADYARRIDQDPGHANARYLGAFFLFDYWGRPTQTPLIPDIVSNRGYYAGGITLMLAASALLLRPAAIRVAFALSALFVLAVVLGVDPFFSAVTALPGFSTAHNGRLVFLVLFCLAMLAGWGLDDLTHRQLAPLGRRRMALAAAAVIFCVPIVWMLVAGTLAPSKLGSALEVAWGFADPPAPVPGIAPNQDVVGIVRLSALLQWLVLAGAGLALIVIALGAGGRLRRFAPVGVIAGLAVAILVADLFRANMGFNPAIPIEHAEQPVTPSLRYLQSRTPNRFAVLSRPGIDQPLQPDLSMRYGLYDARGYDYPVERRYDTFWRANVTAANGDFIEPTQRAGETEKALRGLSLLGVSDLLHYPDGDPLRLPGLRLVYDGPDARIYRNERALPRTFLVAGQRTVDSDDAALAAISKPTFDARGVAVTERAVPGLPAEPDDAAAPDPPGTARLTAYEDERVVAQADARTRSMLVLTDLHFPGWKATVDGEPAKVERVDYLLRGVVVPAGKHRVEFRYEPLSWRIGSIVSILALLALALVTLTGWRKRLRG
jgi:hypothetical protein